MAQRKIPQKLDLRDKWEGGGEGYGVVAALGQGGRCVSRQATVTEIKKA